MPNITLRMTDDDAATLRALAASEHRSMNDVALLAIRDRAAASEAEAASRAAARQLIAENAELLDLLSR